MTVKLTTDQGWISKKIVCCPVCKGEGVTSRSELTDYHKGEYDYWCDFCSTCGGEGRVINVNHTVRVEIDLPDGTKSSNTIKNNCIETLNGRRTEDIYTVGRHNS